MSISLTSGEAYEAMFTFLEGVYRRTESDDLGALLGSMSMLPDGATADPALWQEWERAVQKVMNGEADIQLDLEGP